MRVLKVVAKGAQSAWTDWERGSFSCWLVIGLVVLAVVEERVEVRLFWRVPRVRLAYVEILLERVRFENQNNRRRVQVHWSLLGALLLLACNAMAHR